jgi:hypothetical protein
MAQLFHQDIYIHLANQSQELPTASTFSAASRRKEEFLHRV